MGMPEDRLLRILFLGILGISGVTSPNSQHLLTASLFAVMFKVVATRWEVAGVSKGGFRDDGALRSR
jgi:hypothetical protein